MSIDKRWMLGLIWQTWNDFHFLKDCQIIFFFVFSKILYIKNNVKLLFTISLLWKNFEKNFI